MKTWHIKRNSIVQIGKSIAYKIKWILKNITARFFPKVGIGLEIIMKETNYLVFSQHLPFRINTLFPSFRLISESKLNWRSSDICPTQTQRHRTFSVVRRPCKRYFKACYFWQEISAEALGTRLDLSRVHRVKHITLIKVDKN
jgi:hypothetical protein